MALLGGLKKGSHLIHRCCHRLNEHSTLVTFPLVTNPRLLRLFLVSAILEMSPIASLKTALETSILYFED